MCYSFIFNYFCLLLIGLVSSNPVWVRNFTVNDGQTIFAFSNLSSATVWKVKNGDDVLTPCYFSWKKNSCKNMFLPNNLHYNDVFIVKEKYDVNTDVTGYLFEGKRG